MGGGRFFVPVLPLLVLVYAAFLQHTTHYKRWRYLTFLLLALEVTLFSEVLATGMPLHRMDDFQSAIARHASPPTPEWNDYTWVENSNYIHANDIALLQAFRPLVHHALQGQQTVTVSGVQMGMVPYFLKQEFGDRIYFVDMRGLTTRHVTDCPAFANAQRLWTGLFVDYPHYFAARRQGGCDLPAIKTIKVSGPESLDVMDRYAVSAFLLDSPARWS